MTSISDRVAESPLAGAAGAIARPTVPAAAFVLPAAGVRELRLDLFRGLALWLIFIDHVSPDLLSWFTIRSYGFSDAAEIFIFISGYTAAFVYGRSLLESGFVIAAARIFRRVWQIYAAHILLFTIMVAEVSYVVVYLEQAVLRRRGGDHRFPQAARHRHGAGAAAEISPAEYGRPAALLRADGLSAVDTAADAVARQSHAGDVGRALRGLPCATICILPPIRTDSGRSIPLRGKCCSCSAPGARSAAPSGCRASCLRRSRCGLRLPICWRRFASP